jgi:hypothetical protein
MEDDNNSHCAFLGAVLAFYWIEQEGRPWITSDVGPLKNRSTEETTTSEHVLLAIKFC